MKKILVVDDSAVFLEIIAEILSGNDFEVHTASNGSDGLKKAQILSPDLIIADLFMPDKDGFELIREYRKTSGKSRIIIMSGFGDANNNGTFLNMAIKMGADAAFSKPIDYSALLDRMHKLLG